jgi:spore coat protein CotH
MDPRKRRLVVGVLAFIGVSACGGHDPNDGDAGSDADIDAPADADADSDTDIDVPTDADADSDTDTDDAGADADIDSDIDIDPEIDAEGANDAEIDAEAATDAEIDGDSATDAEIDADDETDSEPDGDGPIDPLPPCVPWEPGFVDPVVASPAGDVFLDLSARLLPVGVAERVLISVFRSGTREVDAAAAGAVVLDIVPPSASIDVSPLVGGQAEAVVHFAEAGRHTLSARLAGGDDRTGTAEAIAYETQLPVWELEIRESDLARIVDRPWETTSVPGTITVDGVGYGTEVRLQGGSSRGFPKKSFRFDLDDRRSLPDGHDHLILRSEWNDKTLLRSYLSYEIFRHTPAAHGSRMEMVHFRINGRYYGVMWRVERVDEDFLRDRGLHPDGSLYAADPAGSCWDPGGSLVPVASMDIYRCIYDQEGGGLDYHDLIRLIEDTLQLPDDVFAATVDDEVNVEEALAYMAVMAVIQNHDHIRKNYYLYRDPYGADDRWMLFPWDLELTFGHLWTAEAGVLDERVFTDSSLYVGRCPGWCNQLLSRLWSVPALDARYREILNDLLETAFTRELIDARIDNAICRGTPDILADRNKRSTNAEYLSRVDEIRTYVDARRAYVLTH